MITHDMEKIMNDNFNLKRKYIVLFVLFFILVGLMQSYGQSLFTRKYDLPKFEITPFTGYMFGGYMNVYQGQITIDNAQNYGLSFVYTIPYKHGIQLEVLWLMHKSALNLQEPKDPEVKKLFDVDTHYIQIGGIYGKRTKNIMPFGSISFGTTVFSPNSVRYSDEWQFSMTLGAGLKFYLSKHVGLRIQARALLPFYWGTGNVWCGTGGCSVGYGSTSIMLQGDFTAGLMITL